MGGLGSGDFYEQSAFIGCSVWCASPAVVCFLDAAYYYGKSEWEKANGIPDNKSRSGMVLDIVFGIISIAVFILGLMVLSFLRDFSYF